MKILFFKIHLAVESYLKKLAHTIVELAGPKFSGRLAGCGLREESMFQSWVHRQSGSRIPSFWGNISLFSLKALADWMGLPHVMEST